MPTYIMNPNKIITFLILGILLIVSCMLSHPSHAQVIQSFQKISALQGGFTEAGGMLEKKDDFGESLDVIGDLDKDGVIDLVVGAKFDDDGGQDRGAVYILFMNTDGTVRDQQKISDTQGGFTGVLDDVDTFGISATGLGDLDGDGVLDIAVGASRDDDTGPFGGSSSNNGAVWILFLNTNGTVKGHQKISETQGGLNRNVFGFGGDLEMLGDLNNNGVEEDFLFVQNSGGFYIISLNSDGTVKASSNRFTQSGSGGFGQTGGLLQDLDGDGVHEIAVGAQFDDDGGSNRGAVWILFMNEDGLTDKIQNRQKISDTTGGFTGQLENGDELGQSVTPISDRNGDGIADIAVGAEHADAPYCTSGVNNQCEDQDTGEVWILHLNTDGTVKSHELIRSQSENFITLRKNANLGQAVTFLGDLNNDGIDDIAASADGDVDCASCNNNTGTMTGAVYILFLEDGTPSGGNQRPVLANISNQAVTENELLTFMVMATDNDGPPELILEASGVPLSNGATFTDNGNGFGEFSWTPNSGDLSGSPYTVTFTATDDSGMGLSDSQNVTITVNPVGGGGPMVVYEFEDLTIADSDGTSSEIKSLSAASNGQFILYNSDAVGEFVTFPIEVSASGTYNLDLVHQLHKKRGTFKVEVAETLGGPYTQIGIMSTTVSSGNSFPTLPLMSTTFSSAGTKYLRFTVTGANPTTGAAKMGLDKIDVTPQGGGGGGSLLGTADNITGNVVDLTAQGTVDWTHWKGGLNPLSRKDNVTPQISDYTLIGSETPSGSGSKATYIWSDGTPVASASTSTGIRVLNDGNGFRVTVPADTTLRTVNVYLGTKSGIGQFTARLSDNSAPVFTTLINQPSGLGTHLVSLNYVAASAGQTLTIEYTLQSGGQIHLEGAALF